MPGKPSKSEQEYFAREEAEKIYKLQRANRKERDEKTKAEQKMLHYMRCPKCGDELHTIQFMNTDIETCHSCGAVVLDKGELEKIIEVSPVELKWLVDLFRS